MYVYKNDFKFQAFIENQDSYFAKKYIEEINLFCEKVRGKPIVVPKFSNLRAFEETGDRRKYQVEFGENRNRLVAFMIRSWLYREKEDITELENILWTLCNEYTWALPAHLPLKLADDNFVPEFIDLAAAELAHAIAETVSICEEFLNPLVVKRCVKEVFRRVIEPFENYQGDWKHIGWWETGPNNWAAVCGGSVGMACVYLIEDEGRLKKLTDRLKAACNCFISSCCEDGACMEGISYWGYAMQYYIGFDELLKARTGESIVIDKEKVRKLVEFPSVMCLSENTVYNYADGGGNVNPLEFGLFCKINERYGIPIPPMSQHNILNKGQFIGSLNNMVRTIAWFNPKLLHNELRSDNVFLMSGQLAVLRNGNMAVGAKGGFNAESHNHNDVGSYKLVKNETVIAAELGAPYYTKAYFKGDRYGFINAGSHGHNLPIVNGYTQSAGAEFAADSFTETEKGVRISFAGAYCKEAEIKSLVRNLSLDENGLKVCDDFEFIKKENVITERVVTFLDAEIISENTVAFMKNGEQFAIAEFVGNCEIKLSKDSFNLSGSGEKRVVTIIDFEIQTASDKVEVVYMIR